MPHSDDQNLAGLWHAWDPPAPRLGLTEEVILAITALPQPRPWYRRLGRVLTFDFSRWQVTPAYIGSALAMFLCLGVISATLGEENSYDASSIDALVYAHHWTEDL